MKGTRACLLGSAVALAAGALAAACGGGVLPGARGAGEVQAAGMAQTFAGKNRCNPKNAARPFVIEWDATDMSSFEARTANDVVFVRYEGCELQVVDACVNDAERGSFGSYKPVEWTSGSIEALDINDQGDLYAKLPLGAASLVGRVEGGEKFHMEYFVSGTRSATREAVYRGELAKKPACKDATHFVYAYNLGAFALGSWSSLHAEAGGTVWGFGAQGDRSSRSRAEKAGGVLASCRGDTAKDVSTCRVPIRLTLREIGEGESPDARAAAAPDTPDAMNLAGKVAEAAAREKKAQEHADAARSKAGARDGKGCLADLDLHDQLDPRPGGTSTNSAAPLAMTRAQCMMLAGQCGAGKEAYRHALEKSGGTTLGPQQIERAADAVGGLNCQGDSMTPREQLLKALIELNQGAYQEKKDAATCKAAFDTAKRLLPTVTPRDDDDTQVKSAASALRLAAPACFAKAGDCDAAWIAWKEAWNLAPRTRTYDEATLRRTFDIHPSVSKCKPH
jgi:hypothetical protein